MTAATGNSFDLVVLGGGPAGCALAILMARRGARVALVEKSAYTSFRPGEHLPPQARGALSALGVSVEALALCAQESAGILSDWGAVLPLTKRYGGPEGFGLNLDRMQFDAALFALAGRSNVTCFARTRLLNAARPDTRWHLVLSRDDHVFDIVTGLVADATGRSAAFARHQNAAWTTHDDLTAVATIVPQQAATPPDNRLHVVACDTGWWSATPTPSGSIVATCYGFNAQRRLNGLSPKQWWLNGLEASASIRERIGDGVPNTFATFPASPRLLRPMHGPGWFAVGDAAACHDPLSGHGILYAFESAFRAAEMASADASLSKIGAVYEEAISSRFARHMALRKDAYQEAAHRFPAATFWQEMVGSD